MVAAAFHNVFPPLDKARTGPTVGRQSGERCIDLGEDQNPVWLLYSLAARDYPKNCVNLHNGVE